MCIRDSRRDAAAAGVCPTAPAAPAAGIPPAKKTGQTALSKKVVRPAKNPKQFSRRPAKTPPAAKNRAGPCPQAGGSSPSQRIPPLGGSGALSPQAPPPKAPPAGFFAASRPPGGSGTALFFRSRARRKGAPQRWREKIPPAQSRRPGPGCSLRSLQPAQPAQPELPAQLEQSPQQRPRRRHAVRSAAPTARRSRAVRNRSIGCIPSPPHSPSSSPA